MYDSRLICILLKEFKKNKYIYNKKKKSFSRIYVNLESFTIATKINTTKFMRHLNCIIY